MGLNDKIKIAFIGAGNMAKEHIKAFADLDNVELSGIFSRTTEKSEDLASEFNIKQVYGSVPELYEGTKADLVVITVSVAYMGNIAIDALEYPWALFLEKPPALNHAEISNLLNKANEKNAVVYTALNRRFLSSTVSAQNNLDKIDAARFIHVQDQQPISRIIDANVHPDNVIEYWMYANCIHLVDYLTVFGRGKVTNVNILSPYQGLDSDVTLAYIDFDSGDKAIYECQWKAMGPWAVRISTEPELWELKPLEAANYQVQGDRAWINTDVSDADKNFKPGFRLQAEEVINALSGKENNAVTLQDTMQTVDLIKAIFQK